MPTSDAARAQLAGILRWHLEQCAWPDHYAAAWPNALGHLAHLAEWDETKHPLARKETFHRPVPVQLSGTGEESSSGFWRPLTAPEVRADMAGQRYALDTLTADLGAHLATSVRDLIADLRQRITRQGLALPQADPAAVRRLEMASGQLTTLRQAIEQHLATAYAQGTAKAAQELMANQMQFCEAHPTATFKSRPGLVGAKAARFFKARAFLIVDLIADPILAKAKLVLYNAIKTGDQPERVTLANLDEAMGEWLPVTNRGGQDVNVPSRLDMVARTNVADSWSAGRQAVFLDPDLPEGFLSGLLMSAVMDDRVRAEHAAWDGIARPAEWWAGPPDRTPPNGFNCLLPGTLVEGAVLIASRGLYAGGAVQVRTESGRRLAVTANHPVLTSRGFVAAGELILGEYVLACYGNVEGSVVGAVDPENSPARVEDVMDALTVRDGAAVASLWPVADDLHGEARWIHGDVDIVACDRELLCNLQAEHPERISETILAAPASSDPQIIGAGTLADLSVGSLAPQGGGVRGGALCGTGRGTHRGPFQAFRVGPAAQWNAGIGEAIRERAAADPKAIGELLQGLSGDVRTDRIVEIERFHFDGHVYDLQTVSGMIVADGILTSNCRCTLIPFFPWDAVEVTPIADLPSGEYPDKGFK